jgi:PKD repeat protein
MKNSTYFFPFGVIAIGSLALFLVSFTFPENKPVKATTGGILTFTVRTVTDNGTYSPKHVLAIWVEDANGFVKTRKAMANQRKQYLYTWKAASNYNVVDAITGSTLTSHQTHTVTWNCTDLSGSIVPDGDYTVWVEFTDKHSQGPIYNITFTKGPDSQSFSPADQTYFKDIQLDFVPYIAEFTSNVSNICQGETVTFTDQSVNATSWSWNFGTGAIPQTANTTGPHIVTYSSPGAVTVSLTINSSITETKTNYITVTSVPAAGFSYSGNEYSVDFSNSSTNATSYLWDFGDGNTSIENNPSHTFVDAGTYNVSLISYNLDCFDIINQDVSVPMVGFTNNLLEINDEVTVFPNPSSGLINIRINQTIVDPLTATVFSSIGKLIQKTTIQGISSTEIIKLNLSGQPKGIYFVNIKSDRIKSNQKIMLY